MNSAMALVSPRDYLAPGEGLILVGYGRGVSEAGGLVGPTFLGIRVSLLGISLLLPVLTERLGAGDRRQHVGDRNHLDAPEPGGGPSNLPALRNTSSRLRRHRREYLPAEPTS